ncbi:MAG: ribonuclease HII [Fusobacteria bacterium]|nr:ribonuclease HII [Fusobacteriota bacterium]
MDPYKEIALKEQDAIRLFHLYENEHQYRQKNKIVVGIDEVGRGPLAGPVCVACVALPFGLYIPKLDDSKKLKPDIRKEVCSEIIKNSYFYSYGFASVEEIDRYNILEATFLAMKRAIVKLPLKPDLVLLDGNKSPKWEYATETIVKGDQLIPSISAASVIAKEKRDMIMDYIQQYDGRYNFSKHKGYGTKEHYEELEEYGISYYHRKSFLKRIIR